MLKRVQTIFFTICILLHAVHAQEQISLHIVCKDKGNEALKALVSLQSVFSNQNALNQYMKDDCLQILWSKGYLAASIDSMAQVGNQYTAFLHLGEQYTWGKLKIDGDLQKKIPSKAAALLPSMGVLMKPTDFLNFSNQLLTHLEENGYPFASIQFDSSYWLNQSLNAVLKINAGPLYHIDSVRIDSRMHINPSFLQHQLGIQKNQLYRRSLLESVSKRLQDLGYVQEYKPWDLNLYASGATLNLYLKQQRSNRFDFLVGLIPANPLLGGKSQLTGDGNMELNNAFGNGEQILLNWQQLQIKSPRLQLHFERPFIFKSNVGLELNFNLLKKDSSYLNLFTGIGLQYRVDQKQMIKFQVKQHLSNVLYVDTQLIKQTQQLQSFLDFSNTQLGVEWTSRGTDDRWNPMKGTDWNFSASTGVKKIRKQDDIINIRQDSNGKPFDYSKLYDAIDLSTVQSNLRFRVDRYSKVGRFATIKTALHAAGMFGKQLYLNEMYQIGGIKTLRGFDEESIFASSYAIGTAEYRYLLDKYSNVFSFIDLAFVQKNLMGTKENRSFLGAGMGLNFMTKSGMFTLAYALGQSGQQFFGIKSSKIHVGFSTLF